MGGAGTIFGGHIVEVGIIRPGFTTISTTEVSFLKIGLVFTITHRSIGIEHRTNCGVSGYIEMDGIVP